jgi:hypothetical protein
VDFWNDVASTVQCSGPKPAVLVFPGFSSPNSPGSQVTAYIDAVAAHFTTCKQTTLESVQVDDVIGEISPHLADMILRGSHA